MSNLSNLEQAGRNEFGHFDGAVIAEWIVQNGQPDRNMKLVEDFRYHDLVGNVWTAPANSVINGASIPRFLWEEVGAPYVGNYRRASVIHDVYCENRTRPSKEVDLMFYHAMRCDNVDYWAANQMWYAVDKFGPSWEVALDEEREISHESLVKLTAQESAMSAWVTKPPLYENDKLGSEPNAFAMILKVVKDVSLQAGPDASINQVSDIVDRQLSDGNIRWSDLASH